MGKWWPFGKKEFKIIWVNGPIPKDFNQSQLDCVSNAKWHCREMMSAGKGGQKLGHDRLVNCFWYIIFSHFESFIDVYSGYTMGLTIASVIEETRSAMETVLLPKLEEIIRCEDQKTKALLVCQYIYILMAAAFDSSGGTIHYGVLREVFGVPELSPEEKKYVSNHRGEFLEPLGFKPYKWTEAGEEHVTWFWPR